MYVRRASGSAARDESNRAPLGGGLGVVTTFHGSANVAGIGRAAKGREDSQDVQALRAGLPESRLDERASRVRRHVPRRGRRVEDGGERLRSRVPAER